MTNRLHVQGRDGEWHDITDSIYDLAFLPTPLAKMQAAMLAEQKRRDQERLDFEIALAAAVGAEQPLWRATGASTWAFDSETRWRVGPFGPEQVRP